MYTIAMIVIGVLAVLIVANFFTLRKAAKLKKLQEQSLRNKLRMTAAIHKKTGRRQK
jgi:type II secretory pathway pseudopilin PulG